MVVDVLINPHHTKTSVYHVLFASFFYTFFMSFIALFLFTQFASVVAIILTAITVTPFFFCITQKKAYT